MTRIRDDADTKRLATFFDNAPDAIVVVAEDGTIVRANDRVADLFGYERSAVEGEPVELLVPDALRDCQSALRESDVDGPGSRSMSADPNLRGRRRDGSTFPVDVRLSPIETDGNLEVIAAIRDVSERQALRRKYRSVMETAPDAMFVVDAETGEILEVNRRATELVGRPEVDLVGREQTVLHPAEDAERYRDMFREHADSGQAIADRFFDGDPLYVETVEGARLPVEISTQVTRLNGRRVVVGLFRDISKRTEYEAELRRQIDRLETLSHVLSHDLRNPLNVAVGRLQLARETGDPEEFAGVEEAHARMKELIEDVLTMIRGSYEVDSVTPLELRSLVAECWANVATADATLDVAADGLVYADPKRIRNLFENLFRNSVEHGSTSNRTQSGDAVEHGGESVTVTVGVTEDGFFVADDGPGIPEDDRTAVFEAGWTTGRERTGLGLSIVSEIATAHGWTVGVGESEDGGARFDFTGVRTAPYEDSFGGPDDDTVAAVDGE